MKLVLVGGATVRAGVGIDLSGIGFVFEEVILEAEDFNDYEATAAWLREQVKPCVPHAGHPVELYKDFLLAFRDKDQDYQRNFNSYIDNMAKERAKVPPDSV